MLRRRTLLRSLAAFPLWQRMPLSARAASRPHIIVILLDDLDAGSVAYMPITQKRIFSEGVTFNQFFATTPLCGPSRATLLTGLYAHNHGVLRNTGESAGFRAFRAFGGETVATALQRAGYRTALIGKFMNGYPVSNEPDDEWPPGWDTWMAGADHAAYEGENYELNENGVVSKYGKSRADYLTEVIAQHAVSFLADTLPAQPTFLFFTPYAPHAPSLPAREDRGSFAGAEAPRGGSFNERRVKKKPRWVRGSPLLTESRIGKIDENYRDRLETLQAADRAIGALLDTVEASGASDSTYVFFLSDNGYFLGEHRQPHGKDAPYDAAALVPLAILGPDLPAGATVNSITGNTDITPTILDLAGVAPTSEPDGRSLLPMIRGDSNAERRYLLLEGFGKETEGHEAGETTTPPFTALRGTGLLYTEYDTQERELYDKRRDPAELDNRVADVSKDLVRRYRELLEELATCSGATCRQLEDAPLAPKERKRLRHHGKGRRRKRFVNG
ncbi:MAG: sulfatase [Chloroflexota bacterium]|nr:sulfatase [Chloroflexota bacterium]